ncbi:MAG: hypothetical protein QOJ49_473, partial [Actinomycetota bacterium]|nr:hypothetical protein [Actinomycetota bacterium]
MTTDALGTGPVGVRTDMPVDLSPLAGTAGRLVAKDADLWGPDAAEEARIRLGWLDLPDSSQELLPRLAALRESLNAAG